MEEKLTGNLKQEPEKPYTPAQFPGISTTHNRTPERPVSQSHSPEVAIIVTVYNKERYLKDTIESILQQNTSRTVALLLSDDGSTDGSREICSDYATRYPAFSAADGFSASGSSSQGRRVFVLDITDGKHRGVAGNFLYCLNYALQLNAKYISQIDSDDILADPDFVNRQTALLESDSSVQAACSSYFLIDENVTLETARVQFNNAQTCRKRSGTPDLKIAPDTQDLKIMLGYKNLKITPEVLLTRNNWIAAGGVTYRTKCLRGYIRDFACAADKTQDLPLWLYLSLFGSFWGCAVKSLAYRNLSESVSRSKDVESQLNFQKASLETRLRFIGWLKLQPGRESAGKKADDTIPDRMLRNRNLDKLAKRAKLLYQKKMLRHYAKLSPEQYPAQLRKSLKTTPALLYSGDAWRSLLVYLKNR